MRSAFFLALLIPLTLLNPLALPAQQDGSQASPAAPCSGPEHRQFDFWIGEWDVCAIGQAAGTNSIRPVHGGCALHESWQGTGEGGISGGSYNIYDQASGRWHQTWVDAAGTLLQLDGGLVDGNMVLSGQRPAPDGKGVTLHRITWTPNEDGSVRQLWEASRNDGNSWSVLFDGLYAKRAELP
jgi:hypothetical protein